MKIHNVQQGTSAWLELRKGIPTASMFDQIVTPEGRPSKSADKYMNHLLAERVIGRPIEGFKSRYMELGNEYEARAVASYEFLNEVTTYKVGFVTTDDGLIGCSPDRFIEESPEGMLEAKAPAPATHVAYLLASIGASREYKVQLQSELWVCEREWVDIISYCDGFPDATFRAVRDDKFIALLEKEVREFSEKLEDAAEKFKAQGWLKTQQIEETNPFGITDEDTIWKPMPWEEEATV